MSKSKTSLLQIKIDDDLKTQSKAFFDEVGLSMTDGIRIYLKYIIKNKNIPFEITTKKTVTNQSFKKSKLESLVGIIKNKSGFGNIPADQISKQIDKTLYDE
jgi:addiction module RelB/DinJ family antitoxin